MTVFLRLPISTLPSKQDHVLEIKLYSLIQEEIANTIKSSAIPNKGVFHIIFLFTYKN